MKLHRTMMAASLPGIPLSDGFTNFKYEPLDLSAKKPSIKLAILLPRDGDGNTIRVSLVHKTFAERPTYEALSYTWGTPDVVKEIELNETRVEVRGNLWSAFFYLRSPTAERALD
jgi:hypothetical protein